ERDHVGRIAVERNLPRPRQHRTARLARLKEGTAIDVHFGAVEFPYHTAGQDPFDESVALQDELFAGRRAHRLKQGPRLLVELAPLKRPYDRFHVNETLDRGRIAPCPMKAQR